MITIIPDAPENVAAFKASSEVTKQDFESVVTPEVARKTEKFEELNYLMLIDTDLNNFTAGAWLEDVLLGLNNLAKWNRAAIVTDSSGIQNFTEIFSVLMPGEFKAFPKENLYNALYWCQNGNEVEG
ncbi:STAS/SEC14 domain-containing protein [Chryseobacterium sp.]|uniref:STAS/SEC14 domain-containing protein n=1 Tax=Chryseobacterium sp. TaxID=1871047 RepID=UPI00289DE015|nr:STAS/SEC14 domain-containing protein [Chryseobacterium sp.]